MHMRFRGDVMSPRAPIGDRVDSHAIYERNCPDCNKQIKKNAPISIKNGQQRYRHKACYDERYTECASTVTETS